MKLFCYFMALALANVLAEPNLQFKTEVYKTNYYFKKISENPSKVDASIETIICIEKLEIVNLSGMLVLPEPFINGLGSKSIPLLATMVADEQSIQTRLRTDHNIKKIPKVSEKDILNMDWEAMVKYRRDTLMQSFLRLLTKVESGSTELNDEQKCFLVGLYENGRNPSYLLLHTHPRLENGVYNCYISLNMDKHSLDLKFRMFDDGLWLVNDVDRQAYQLTAPIMKTDHVKTRSNCAIL